MSYINKTPSFCLKKLFVKDLYFSCPDGSLSINLYFLFLYLRLYIQVSQPKVEFVLLEKTSFESL